MGYAEKPTFVIDIDKTTGEISAESFGYFGDSCIDDITKLMGDLATLTSDDSKPERWQSELAKGSSVHVGKNL